MVPANCASVLRSGRNFSISLGNCRSSCEFSHSNNLKTIGPKFAHTAPGPKHGKRLQIPRATNIWFLWSLRKFSQRIFTRVATGRRNVFSPRQRLIKAEEVQQKTRMAKSSFCHNLLQHHGMRRMVQVGQKSLG